MLVGMIVSYSVFPSSQVSQSIVEPYNAMLAIQYHIESTDMLACFDNEALYQICSRALKISLPTINDRKLLSMMDNSFIEHSDVH
jgi:tubulin beta